MVSALIYVLSAAAIAAAIVVVLYLRGLRRTTGFILELLSVEGVASGRFIGYQTCVALAGTTHHSAELFVYARLYRMWRDGLVNGSVRHRWAPEPATQQVSLEVKDMDWKLTERGQLRLEQHFARGRR